MGKSTAKIDSEALKRVKIYAANHDMKGYEVIEKALEEFFAKRKPLTN